MPITNADAILFSKDQARTAANALAKAYFAAKECMNVYYARPGLSTLFSGNLAEVVSDDQAPTYTGNGMLLLITRCSELVTDLEANGNAKLNTILAVANDMNLDV